MKTDTGSIETKNQVAVQGAIKKKNRWSGGAGGERKLFLLKNVTWLS